jgi:hypothetical protein
LRILVWEDDEAAPLGHRDPGELDHDYDVGQYRGALQSMATLLDALIVAAAG